MVHFCGSFFVILLLGIESAISAGSIDPKNCKIWGPAIDENANVPVRYFYIQAFDFDNNPISKDLGNHAFRVQLRSNNFDIGVSANIANLRNGTYLARFRLPDFGGKLEILVTHARQHVAKSPYKFKHYYGDGCNCAMPLDTWKNALKCPVTFERLEKDMKPFPSIDLDALVEEGIPRYLKNTSHCHYVIKDNLIYRDCYGEYTSLSHIMDVVLLMMTAKVRLPNVEFIINFSDWCIEHDTENPLPLFSWSKVEDCLDVLLPTYDLAMSVAEEQRRVYLCGHTVQAEAAKYAWDTKIEKGHFRGRDSLQGRLDLAEMSVKNPEYLDCAITNYYFNKPNEDKYGKKATSIPVEDFFKYKYVINVDGTVAAYRMPYLLFGGSVIFKQDSGYKEHFYDDIKPWIHYVPLKADLSDVIEKVKWAREHDDEVRKIALAGSRFAQGNLNPETVLCYYAQAFEIYSARSNRSPEILKSMELVAQPETSCDCHWKRSAKKKEEL